MIKVNNKIYHNIIYTIFLVLFLLEPFSKIFDESNSNLRAKAILKIALLVTLIIFAIFAKIKKEVFFILLTLMLCFLIGQYMLTEKYSIFGGDILQEIKGGDIYIMIKYLYILFFVGVYEKIEDNKNLTKKLINLFNWFMIINTVFIGIGLITQWELFKTYPNTNRFGYRFGYQGLIELAGESIHLYTIAISLAYVSYVKTKKYGSLLLFIIGGVLLGKKVIFLYLLLLLLFHVIYLKKRKVLYGIGFVAFILVTFNKYIIEKLVTMFPFWKDLYESKGVVTVVFSKRDILFQNSINYIQENWHPLNYIFGGIDFSSVRSEFGFFDLFLALGIVGTFLYCWFLYKFFLLKHSLLIKTVFIIIFIAEAFSGGLIINITPMIFLYLGAKYLEEKYILIT